MNLHPSLIVFAMSLEVWCPEFANNGRMTLEKNRVLAIRPIKHTSETFHN